MSRLIDADEFDVVGTKIPEGMDPESYMAGMDFMLNKIDDAPTIEPEKKKGRWVQNNNGTWSCSECQSWIPNEQHYYANFCLHCGAEME